MSKNILLKFTHSVICVLLVAALVIPLFPYEKEIKAIASVTAEGITNAGIKTVAVVDFTDLQGNVTELGRFLAEELSISLTVLQKGFEVIDRTHLKTLLQEHKLSSTGIIDPQTARKLGQIAGVEALITGTITAFGDSVRVSVKVLNTETAKMIAATSTDIAKTKAIEELLEKGIGTSTNSVNGSEPNIGSSRLQDSKSSLRMTANSITFELKQCKLSGRTLTFYLLIINSDSRDRSVGFGNPRFIDNFGNEYKENYIMQFGNEKRVNYWWIENNLVSGIPMKASIIFENVPQELSQIALFEIQTNSNYKIQFKNLRVIGE